MLKITYATAFEIEADIYTVEVGLGGGAKAYHGGTATHAYLTKEQAEALATKVFMHVTIDPQFWTNEYGYPLGFSASSRRDLEEQRRIEDELQAA